MFAQQSLSVVFSQVGCTVPVSWGFELPRGFRPNKRWPDPATIQNSSKYQLAGFNSLVVHPLKSIMQPAVFLACPLRTRFILFGLLILSKLDVKGPHARLSKGT